MGLLSFFFRNKKVEKLETDVKNIKNELESIRTEIENTKELLSSLSSAIKLLDSKLKKEAEKFNIKMEEVEEKISILIRSTKIGVEAKKEVESIKLKIEELEKLVENKKIREKKKGSERKIPDVGIEDRALSPQSSDFMKTLSHAEREIISVLLSSEIPLSYEEIAEKCGKSPSTVRDHINSIRRKADIIEVVEAPDRKKLFKIIPLVRKELIF